MGKGQRPFPCTYLTYGNAKTFYHSSTRISREVLGDCSSQRNLSAAGTEQASRIGKRLKMARLSKVTVYSSQWCRCLDTAKGLGIGPVAELPALNSC